MSGNFVIYLLGYILVVAGVAYGMHAAGLGSQWILAVTLVFVGLGVVYALSRSQRDAASREAANNPSGASQPPPASHDAP